MLHTQLLEIVNSRQAWAFVGSGPSSYAGAPSWSDLVKSVADDPVAAPLQSDPAFTGAQESGNYPRCFSLLESAIGRDALEEHIRQSIGSVSAPGELHAILANLPFQGYITTNYDSLLEDALSQHESGWIPVGNTSDEVRKVSGGAGRIVWHVHGALNLPQEASHLVLTTRDYDDFYLEDSDLLRQLRSLMAQRRVVIVGFGFADQEVLRLLRRVGRMTVPARPIYAFLAKKGDFASTVGRKVWLQESNTDVIPYKIRAGGHRALKDLLEVYSSLSLRRSLRYRGDGAAPPSYDPETTGLLIYNELVLARRVELPSDIRAALLRARLLAQLNSQGPLPNSQLAASVAEPAMRLSRNILGISREDEVHREVGESLSALRDLGLASFDPATETYSLTEAGISRVADHAALAGRMEDQFSASLRARAVSVCAEDIAVQRVTAAAEAFLKGCIEKRALGVAMAINVTQPAQLEYHLLALLQSLSEYLETLEDEEEARRLIQVIEQVFRAPSDVEREYIGVTLQARFGVHLLGYDDATLATRMADVYGTAFVVDSTALIGLLARSSPNSDMNFTLMRELKNCSVTVITTPMLVAEVTEHIQWAQDRVAEVGSFQSLPVLEAATGRAGERSNAFLEGFAVELATGRSAIFSEYIREVCSLDRATTRVTRPQVERTLATKGVATYGINELSGFNPEVYLQMEEHQARLRELRATAETFTREMQVAAEAEALDMVQGIRAERLSVQGSNCTNAYFISNTRIIDQVAHSAVPITIKPEAAVQWLVTLHPCPLEELGTLTSGLLWELQERGQDLVDPKTLLTAFSPLIEASEQARDAEVARLRALTGNVYAGAAEALNMPVADLDLPIVLESHNAQLVRELQQALEEERKRASAATISDAERQELERFRDKERKRIKYQRRADRQREGRGKRGKRRK
jgi:hypothetical protein